MTTVRGISSRVDMAWSSNGTEIKKIEGVNVIYTGSNLAMYLTYYVIPLLGTVNNDEEYQCEVMINTNPPVMDSNYIALNGTGMFTLIS